MAFTAMVMTADKEEVVDFIAPYFEQSGISIGKFSYIRITPIKTIYRTDTEISFAKIIVEFICQKRKVQ